MTIYDWHLELQNKWNKAFWVRGCYVTIKGYAKEKVQKKYNGNNQKFREKKIIKGLLCKAVRNRAFNICLSSMQVVRRLCELEQEIS